MRYNFERIAGTGVVVWLALVATAHGQFGYYGPGEQYGWAPHRAIVDSRHVSDDRYRPVVSLPAHERPGFERGVAALHKPVRGRFHEAKLQDVIRRLEAESGCPIRIDVKALMDEAIALDTPVTLDLDAQLLRVVLDGVLRPHALAFTPKSPGLLVTTQSQVDTNPDLRPVVIYPVFDLVALRYNGGIEFDYDSLINPIVEMVHPESWREGGTGEGRIEPEIHSVGIVVQQTWEVHEAIDGLLTTMRAIGTRLPVEARARSSRRTRDSVSDDGGRYEYRPRSRGRQRAYWGKDSTPPAQVHPQVGGFF